MSYGIILFDGVCNLCNGAVNFIIDRDPEAYFHFAALQSEAGQKMLQELGLSQQDFDTIVLIEGNKHYTHSTAALRIARKLKAPWSLAGVLLLVPAFIRNAVYRQIAKNRYQWFGKSAQCRLPTPALKARFLD
ncbi:MAG: thiol-disulfide oxidoreductase DCC family protein [Candidatus Sericytochromatia bacterium]|nr:thiol-disulfide oxidoreductase DCC family protein [Candidatus Sericytochromatia bacterium]